MKKYKTFYFLFFLVVIYSSCRNDSCMESMESNLNIHFYKYKTAKDSVLNNLSVYGSGMSDTLLYNGASSISFIKLPLDRNNDQSQFILQMVVLVDTINVYYIDTLTLTYKRETEMVSPECGFGYIIELDSVWSTKNMIDSVYINKVRIERENNDENVKLFL